MCAIVPFKNCSFWSGIVTIGNGAPAKTGTPKQNLGVFYNAVAVIRGFTKKKIL